MKAIDEHAWPAKLSDVGARGMNAMQYVHFRGIEEPQSALTEWGAAGWHVLVGSWEARRGCYVRRENGSDDRVTLYDFVMEREQP